MDEFGIIENHILELMSQISEDDIISAFSHLTLQYITKTPILLKQIHPDDREDH